MTASLVSQCVITCRLPPFLQFLCFYVGYTSTVYCTASVLTLTVIALDCYHSIVDCLHYRSISTPRRTIAVVVWIWVQSLAISFPPLVGWCSLSYVGPMFICGVNWARSPGYTVFVTVLSYLLPAAVILFCYLSIIRVARSHVRRIHSLADSVNRLPTGDSSQNQSERSLQSPSGEVWHVSGQFEPARQADSAPPESLLAASASLATLQSSQQPQNGGVVRLLLIIAAFFLCWTPYTVVAFVQTTESAISGQSSLVPPAAVTSSYFLVLLNSAINPLLYALLSRRYRVALRGLIQRMRVQLRSVLAIRGEARTKKENKGTLATNHPRPPSSSETDDTKCCTPVFTITDTENTSQEHLCNVYSSNKTPRASSTREDPGRNSKVDYLYVPPSPQEGSRLPFSALTKERQATFYFGEVTVRVEHDVC